MSDYIKRENVLNTFSTAFYSGLAAKINEIPAEDVAPVRHGRWEKNDDYTCSLCGYRMVIGDGAYNYCPNCGARMDGEEDEID